MEKKQVKKKIKKKQNLNTASKYLLIVAIILVIMIAYFIYKLVIFIQNPTDTFTVEQGQIYQEEDAIGYIIREETIVKGSNYKNGMEQKKSEGEKVAKGDAIFRYYSNGEESLTKKIQELDEKIDEAMSKEEGGNLPGDIKTIEKQIEDKLISLQNANNMQTIRETKKEIANNITKKAKIAGELSTAGSYLKKLVDERQKYENELNEGAEYVKAPVSGIVSYKVDGYEDVLTPNDFGKLNSEFLESLEIKTGQVIADNKESAKIINNFECYIAYVLTSEQAKSAKEGDTVKLRLPNGQEISAELAYIIPEDGKVVLIFKIDKQVSELISYRKISVDIIWWSDSGRKIPNDAIAYEQKGENSVAYLIRVRGDYTDKIWIKIKRQNDKYAIVENYTSKELQELGYTTEEIEDRGTLSLYDEILRNPTE